MANLIQSSGSDPSQPSSFNSTKFSGNHVRNLSFSSYLNPTEEAHIHKVVLPGERSLSFNTEPEVDRPFFLECKVQDGEIEVFEAEKYFNGEIDCEDRLKGIMSSKKPIELERKKEESEGEQEGNTAVEPVRPRVNKMSIPSVGSDVCSTNSQSALLRNIVGNLSRKRIRKVYSGWSLLSLMSCSRCSCSGKGFADDIVDDGSNSTAKFSSPVDAKSSEDCASSIHNIALMSDGRVNEEIRTQKSRTRAGNYLAQKPCLELSSLKLGHEEEHRKSLEVFESPLFGKIMLDTSIASATKEDISEVLNETGSDASSDLFEIESLTGKVNSYLTRHATDATPGCLTPTKGRYGPSEASIDWSVVTASAAEFSVLTNYEEMVSGKPAAANFSGCGKNVTKEAPERPQMAGILLGCSNQKTVHVAGATRKVTYGSSGWRSDPTLTANPVARFQADPKYGNIPPHLLYFKK
ncbi:hypothetical protein SAY87_016946 [Trapa incisa]|uniref:Phytochrome kinase substrate 1 n=1 Tax=Trapa incisa TaxID=236973 RepID=A0AAN7L9G9_9MYRT|nr:hypothetical protein SAY87_016946 [Trapa incisa]